MEGFFRSGQGIRRRYRHRRGRESSIAFVRRDDFSGNAIFHRARYRFLVRARVCEQCGFFGGIGAYGTEHGVFRHYDATRRGQHEFQRLSLERKGRRARENGYRARRATRRGRLAGGRSLYGGYRAVRGKSEHNRQTGRQDVRVRQRIARGTCQHFPRADFRRLRQDVSQYRKLCSGRGDAQRTEIHEHFDARRRGRRAQLVGCGHFGRVGRRATHGQRAVPARGGYVFQILKTHARRENDHRQRGCMDSARVRQNARSSHGKSGGPEYHDAQPGGKDRDAARNQRVRRRGRGLKDDRFRPRQDHH